MSAVIRQMVARKRAAAADRQAFIAERDKIVAESRGADGKTPAHEWDGTRLRFEQPDGSWGEWVDLRGKKGANGDRGAEGVTVVTGGGGAKFDPATLDILQVVPTLSDFLLLERDGVSYRVRLDQLAALFGGTVPESAVRVNDAPIYVNGDYVTVTRGAPANAVLVGGSPVYVNDSLVTVT